MKKSAIIMVVVGILILVGLYFYTNKSKPVETSQTYQTPQVPQPMEVVVNYKSNSGFQPQSYRVTEGQQVVIKVTSDVADELHFHGYDLHIDLEAGKEGQIAFIADKTGSFEFELETHKITLGEIQVYPK